MKPIRTVLALTVVLALAAYVQAGEGKKGKGKQGNGTRGVVTSVDTSAKTFTFRSGKKKDPNAKEVTVQFNDKTKFVKLGEGGTAEGKAEDLTAKKRVAVVFETKDDKNVASEVTIIDLPKKKKKN